MARREYSVCAFPADRRLIEIGDYYADFSKIRSNLLTRMPDLARHPGHLAERQPAS